MIEFLKQYGVTILLAVTLVADVIIIPCITKKYSTKDGLLKFAEILQDVPGLIIEAEKMLGSGTGAAKLQYVLNKIHLKCLENNVKYTEIDVVKTVETILSTPTTNKGE